MENTNRLKTELEQKYKAILDIHRNKIDFSFFVAIDEYVRLIDKNDYLRDLLFGSKPFATSNPHNLIIERGREIADLNRVFKDKSSSNIFIAYFNLYAVYVGVEDMDCGLEKDSDFLNENRLKMVKHLENIRDREKIVGHGYFWFNKSKYHEWARIIHHYILDLIDNDKKTTVIETTPIVETTAVEKEEDIKAKVVEVVEKEECIKYKYDSASQLGQFNFNGKELDFRGTRALVFNFFYMLDKIGDQEFKTYHAFNKYLTENNVAEKVDSVSFRQSIDNINDRIKKDIGDIKAVIELKDKNNPKGINFYKWKIKI